MPPFFTACAIAVWLVAVQAAGTARQPGTGNDELVFEGDATGEAIFPEAWSPDGQHVIFARNKTPGPVPTDLWVLPLSGDRKADKTVEAGQPVLLFQTAAEHARQSWSQAL